MSTRYPATLPDLPAVRAVTAVWLRCLSALVGLGLLLLPLSPALADNKSILVLVSQDKPLYRAVYEAFANELRAAASQSVALTPVFLDRAEKPSEPAAARPDFVVAIGTAAMTDAAERFRALPGVVLFVPKARFEQVYADAFVAGAAADMETPGVVVLDQPIMRQATLAQRLVPEGKIGLILGPDTRYFETYLKEFQPELARHTVVAHVDEASEIVPAAQIVASAVDVIVATPDSLVWSSESAKWLLYLAYQKRKPVIGFSAALARAGALVSVFSEPDQIGRQGGEKVVQWLRGDTGWRTTSSPKYFRYEINRNMAAVYDLEPEALLSDLEGEAR